MTTNTHGAPIVPSSFISTFLRGKSVISANVIYFFQTLYAPCVTLSEGDMMAKKWKCKSCGTENRLYAVTDGKRTPTDFCTNCHFTQQRLEV